MAGVMQRIVLFARRPRLGRVKTRLAPSLGTEQVLQLYRAFLDDQIRFLLSFRARCDVELCLDGPAAAEDDLSRLPGELPPTHQGPGDLGRRMFRAVQRAATSGCRGTVVIPADAPTLPADRVLDALDELERGTPAVVVPAEDGGYVLIGVTDPHAELFRDVPWGGPDVLQVTLERARTAGIAMRQLEPWYDIDDEAGLRRLRAEVTQPAGAARAPATARALARLDSPERPVV